MLISIINNNNDDNDNNNNRREGRRESTLIKMSFTTSFSLFQLRKNSKKINNKNNN